MSTKVTFLVKPSTYLGAIEDTEITYYIGIPDYVPFGVLGKDNSIIKNTDKECLTVTAEDRNSFAWYLDGVNFNKNFYIYGGFSADAYTNGFTFSTNDKYDPLVNDIYKIAIYALKGGIKSSEKLEGSKALKATFTINHHYRYYGDTASAWDAYDTDEYTTTNDFGQLPQLIYAYNSISNSYSAYSGAISGGPLQSGSKWWPVVSDPEKAEKYKYKFLTDNIGEIDSKLTYSTGWLMDNNNNEWGEGICSLPSKEKIDEIFSDNFKRSPLIMSLNVENDSATDRRPIKRGVTVVADKKYETKWNKVEKWISLSSTGYASKFYSSGSTKTEYSLSLFQKQGEGRTKLQNLTCEWNIHDKVCLIQSKDSTGSYQEEYLLDDNYPVLYFRDATTGISGQNCTQNIDDSSNISIELHMRNTSKKAIGLYNLFGLCISCTIKDSSGKAIARCFAPLLPSVEGFDGSLGIADYAAKGGIGNFLENITYYDENGNKQLRGYIYTNSIVAGTYERVNSRGQAEGLNGVTMGEEVVQWVKKEIPVTDKDENPVIDDEGKPVTEWVESASERHYGIRGWNNGYEMFDLNTKESSIRLGKYNEGQIYLKSGTNGQTMIKSGNYVVGNKLQEGAGIEINFSTKPSITYGNGNFIVNSEGELTAKGASITGNFEVDNTSYDMNCYNSLIGTKFKATNKALSTDNADSHTDYNLSELSTLLQDETCKKAIGQTGISISGDLSNVEDAINTWRTVKDEDTGEFILSPDISSQLSQWLNKYLKAIASTPTGNTQVSFELFHASKITTASKPTREIIALKGESETEYETKLITADENYFHLTPKSLKMGAITTTGELVQGFSYNNGEFSIVGSLSATNGTIGGWSINKDKIISPSRGLILNSNGRIEGYENNNIDLSGLLDLNSRSISWWPMGVAKQIKKISIPGGGTAEIIEDKEDKDGNKVFTADTSGTRLAAITGANGGINLTGTSTSSMSVSNGGKIQVTDTGEIVIGKETRDSLEIATVDEFRSIERGKSITQGYIKIISNRLRADQEEEQSSKYVYNTDERTPISYVDGALKSSTLQEAIKSYQQNESEITKKINNFNKNLGRKKYIIKEVTGDDKNVVSGILALPPTEVTFSELGDFPENYSPLEDTSIMYEIIETYPIPKNSSKPYSFSYLVEVNSDEEVLRLVYPNGAYTDFKGFDI